MLIEYKIRPVTRYVVTRFETSGPDENGRGDGSSTEIGTYPSGDVAYEVGYALAKAEHDRLGFPPGDERIIYPQEIGEVLYGTGDRKTGEPVSIFDDR